MIPIETALRVARRHGYDQVVILGRRVDTDNEKGHEHVTTAGLSPEHCRVAARMGDFLKYRVMGWPEVAEIDRLREALKVAEAERDAARAEAAEAEVKRLRGAAGVMCDLLRTAIGVVDSLADEESEDPDEMRMYRARLVAAVEMWDLPARPADGGAE